MNGFQELEKWVRRLQATAGKTGTRDTETERVPVPVADLVAAYVRVAKSERLESELLNRWKAAHPDQAEVVYVMKSKWPVAPS